MTLKGVLEWTSGRVHAMVGGHERVLHEPLLVALPEQAADVLVVVHLAQQTTHQLRGKHVGVLTQDGAPETERVGNQHDFSPE
jgi:hypothetical protein